MWEISISNQIITSLYSVVFGFITCVYYDVFKAFRKCGCNSWLAVLFQDIFFWTTEAIAVFIFLISRTNGEVRGYVIVSLFLGFIIFRLTLSRFVLKSFVVTVLFVRKIFRRIYKIFDNSVTVAERFFASVYKKIQKILHRVHKILKKLLKSNHRLLYTETDNKSNGDESVGS